MSFRINTNISAMTANLHSNLSNLNLDRSLGALSSGSAINSAAHDASGLAIANQLSSQVSGLGQAIMNSNDSIGMMQIADGAMQGISDNTQRIRTLTLQASNGILNADNRAAIQREIDGLMESSNHIANTTSFNGKQLLNGSNSTLITHTGANSGETLSVDISDARSSSLFSNTIDVTSQASANSSLDILDAGQNNINEIRSALGSTQNQLLSNIRNISVTRINTASAQSQIKDIDFAAESANFSQANISAQIGSFVQSQANASQSNVLNLFK